MKLLSSCTISAIIRLRPETATSKNFVTIREVHSYNTRKASRNHLYTRRARRTQAQKSLLHAGTSIWNDFPSQTLNAPYNKFKKLLKVYLLQSIQLTQEYFLMLAVLVGYCHLFAKLVETVSSLHLIMITFIL